MIRVKILWLSHRDIRHPRAGGAELTIYEVGKRLVADGHKVNWITPRPIASPKKELIDGIIISRIGGNLIVHVASIIYILTMRQDYDIIIDDMGHAMPWFSRLITRKPVIVYFRHRHSRTLKGQVNRILASFLTLMERGYRIFYRGCAFVTESESSLQDLISMGIPETKIFLNPPGVDTTFFHPRNKSEQPLLCYYGGMRSYKRPEMSIKVFELVKTKFPNSRLTLMGSGPSLKKIEDIAKASPARDSISVLGRVETEKLAEIVSTSWVNLHFSISEGYGYSILESTAAGTPTVAFDVPGVRNAIDERHNGYLVPDGNVHAFAEKVGDIIRRNLHTVDVEGIMSKYSWDETSHRLVSLINSIIHSRH